MKAIILAAGMGKRLADDTQPLPKVMRTVGGRPLIDHVLGNLSFLAPEDRIVVVGYKKDQVISHLQGRCRFAVQHEQLGTAHAVHCAQDALRGYTGDVLVCFGDMPLLSAHTYTDCIQTHRRQNAHATVLVADMQPPPPWGRVLLAQDGSLIDIVEDKDCTDAQRAVTCVHVGINIYRAPLLFDLLPRLPRSAATGEYYLTALPSLFVREGYRVRTVQLQDTDEAIGINTPADLAACERLLAARGTSL